MEGKLIISNSASISNQIIFIYKQKILYLFVYKHRYSDVHLYASKDTGEKLKHIQKHHTWDRLTTSLVHIYSKAI